MASDYHENTCAGGRHTLGRLVRQAAAVQMLRPSHPPAGEIHVLQQNVSSTEENGSKCKYVTTDGVRAVTDGIQPNTESRVRDVDRKLPWLRVRMPTGEHFKGEYSESSMAKQKLLDQIARLPCWLGAVEISPLLGGMTNHNFLVADRHARRFVVRIGRDLPEHGVMRFNELAAARAAHAAGISPEVIHAGDGILVSRYIDGRAFAPEDVREARHLDRIVDLVRRCHLDIPRYFRGPALIFWVFQVVRNYLAKLAEVGKNPLGLELPKLARISMLLEQMVGPVTIVFGHNDLLAANLIDDGERLWLIDWDYAGFNSPLFDLANLSSNNALTPDMETLLLQRYFGRFTDEACHRGFVAMKCASLLRELLWAAVSQASSTIEFDYASYANDYLTRFEWMWQDVQRNMDTKPGDTMNPETKA